MTNMDPRYLLAAWIDVRDQRWKRNRKILHDLFYGIDPDGNFVFDKFSQGKRYAWTWRLRDAVVVRQLNRYAISRDPKDLPDDSDRGTYEFKERHPLPDEVPPVFSTWHFEMDPDARQRLDYRRMKGKKSHSYPGERDTDNEDDPFTALWRRRREE